MTKDVLDTHTADLLAGEPTKKRRGRPPKAKALSGAERQAAYRANTLTLTIDRKDVHSLKLILGLAVPNPDLGITQDQIDRMGKALSSASYGKDIPRPE